MSIEGVERFLNLEPRSRILHLGCGNGRQTLELAMLGHRVLGLDATDAALAEARHAARHERLNVHFIKSDPRQIPYRGEFDAVVCLAGAFGRLASDRDDLRMLESVQRALRPGGQVLIEAVNRERLIRHFEPNVWEPGQEGRGDVLLDRMSFNLENGRLDTHRVVFGKGGARAPVFVSQRLYALTELKALLAQAGLSYRQCWGDFDANPYGMDSRRLVVLAAKGNEPAARRRAQAEPQTIRIKGRSQSRRK